MTASFFFERDRVLTLREIITLTKAEPRRVADLDQRITGVAALDHATRDDLAFLDSARYADQAMLCDAGACLTSERFAGRLPDGVAVLCLSQPYRAFVEVARTLFPDSLRPSALFETRGLAPGATIHAQARLEPGVTVDTGAVIGPLAEIGAGTVIAPGAVIGPKVRIGRDCRIGANVAVTNALIGDRVIIHPGCAIGQDGFGYVMGPGGHRKVPQLGRVIIQDDVEIGANTSVDRGAIRDTIIGEGTKIDNCVQIGHNVVIGRHCVLVSQAGISGSATLEDYVVLGGRVAVNNHVVIGEGAQIAASSSVKDSVPAGGRWGGTPAKPAKQWFREMVIVERLAARPGDADSPAAAGHDDQQGPA